MRVVYDKANAPIHEIIFAASVAQINGRKMDVPLGQMIACWAPDSYGIVTVNDTQDGVAHFYSDVTFHPGTWFYDSERNEIIKKTKPLQGAGAVVVSRIVL